MSWTRPTPIPLPLLSCQGSTAFSPAALIRSFSLSTLLSHSSWSTEGSLPVSDLFFCLGDFKLAFWRPLPDLCLYYARDQDSAALLSVLPVSCIVLDMQISHLTVLTIETSTTFITPSPEMHQDCLSLPCSGTRVLPLYALRWTSYLCMR